MNKDAPWEMTPEDVATFRDVYWAYLAETRDDWKDFRLDVPSAVVALKRVLAKRIGRWPEQQCAREDLHASHYWTKAGSGVANECPGIGDEVERREAAQAYQGEVIEGSVAVFLNWLDENGYTIERSEKLSPVHRPTVLAQYEKHLEKPL